MNIRQAISVLVVVLYLIITSSIGLLHNEGCAFGATKSGTEDTHSSTEACPACKFSAGFNSVEEDDGLLLLDAESPAICQPVWHFTVVDHHEWAYSIFLRAPPLTSTS